MLGNYCPEMRTYAGDNEGAGNSEIENHDDDRNMDSFVVHEFSCLEHLNPGSCFNVYSIALVDQADSRWVLDETHRFLCFRGDCS